jgi:hypothetical protein
VTAQKFTSQRHENERLYGGDVLAPNFQGEYLPETVPPKPNRLVADVDPPLEQQVFDNAQ